jgi:steroid delta-isomerase-like uncharacterized protein
MPDNKARAQAFWAELFNAHDLTGIRGFLAPGFVNHNARPGTPDGPAGAGQVFSRLWAGCSDMHFDLQEMIAEGSKVVCVGVMTGTHDGPLHGIPATHRPTAARQIHVLTFNDTGMITEHMAVRDDVTVLRQLGALPAASPGDGRTAASRIG